MLLSRQKCSNILGAAFSGKGIAVEIAAVAKHVTLSHKTPPLPTNLPSNVNEKLPIKEIDTYHLVVFEDDSICEADIIVFCTGYLYDFPFLTPECEIKVKNKKSISFL